MSVKFLRNRLKRRDFAKAIGASALTLPFWRALRGEAQTEAPPIRFLVFFTPNGTIQNEYVPEGGETDFRLKRILEPLEPHRQHLIVTSGIDMVSASSGPGDGHQTGMGHMLTGRELLPGNTGGGCDSCAPVSWASGISIDQHIANHISTETPYRSVELGVQVSGSNVWTRMAYRAGSEPLPPESDPYAAFDRLFGAELGDDPFGLERRKAQKESVLRNVQDDFRDLQSRLGQHDRERLQIHLDVVADLERRLQSEGTGGFGAGCAAPMLGERIDVRRDENFHRVLDMQMDIATAAFACDLTRVASIQASQSVGNNRFPWLGIESRHHDLSHDDANSNPRETLVEINRWYAEMFASLIERMQQIPEPTAGDPNATLLDHTVILWCNELGEGGSHTRNDIPFLLAGSGGGALRTGRYHSYDRQPHNDLLRTLANAFGIEDTTFGDQRWNDRQLTELLA